MRDDVDMDEKPFTSAWLKQQFLATGKRQKDLVVFLQERGIEIDATKVSKTVSGARDVQRNEIAPIWQFFDLPADDLPAALESIGQALQAGERQIGQRGNSPMPNAGLPERVRLDTSQMPIYGAAVGGGPRSRLLFNGQILGTVTRPESLASNPKAYAVYVHGDSMEPRYEAGEIVLVNPDKGYRKGNYVVAQVYDNDGDPPFGYVKRFVSFGEELVLEQLNPPEGEDRLMRFHRNHVVSVHRIVGTLDE
ncbi:phage repressor protein C with HTH and peptisase S24 domain [Methylobacterium sp. RAS18]|nr:phage repressor protein C with HTH and peptisase S24 domain [Methylobacterium sp. RAS18]